MSRTDDQLAVIAGMTGDNLKAQWRAVFNTVPPPGFNLDMLRLALAYAAQERTSGRLPTNIARQIERQARTIASKAPVNGAALPTGTRLVRDWHQVSHHVLVTEAGYLYRDRPFSSLTSIAREITGVPWSGPRFFGLVNRKKGAAHA